MRARPAQPHARRAAPIAESPRFSGAVARVLLEHKPTRVGSQPQMLRPPATPRPTLHLLGRTRPRLCAPPHARTLFGWFKKAKAAPAKKEPAPVLSQDDLFHPFSQSPFPAIRARGEAIQKLAPCPVCAAEAKGAHGGHAHTHAQPKAVKFECPDCGWPTHCSEEHWRADTEHKKYCSRLREVNEDEHDMRSGRRMKDFELPGTDYVRLICRPHHGYAARAPGL